MRLLSLLLLGGAALRAAAQSPPALPSQLSPDARVAIQRLMDSASAVGIPTTPLSDKAAEGVLKGADDRKIVIAVQSLLHQLTQAHEILGSGNKAVPYSLLGAVASALQAGVPVADLRRLANPSGAATMPDQRALTGALVALVDLIAKHVPTSVASSSIEDLLRRRATEDQFVALRSEVAQDILSGQTPEAALAARTRAYLRALDAGQSPARGLGRPPQAPDNRPL